MGARDYSTTAASNLSVGGISIAEGWARASVNNAYRAGMADTANLLRDLGGATTTSGASNAYLVSLDSSPTAYADNLLFLATSNHTNTGPATINLNSIGVKDIEKLIDGVATPLAPGDFQAGHIGIFTYSSGNNSVMLLSPAGTGLVSNTMALYDSRTAAAAATINASVAVVQTHGYATAGDGGGALYVRRGVTEPTYPGKFQSADGDWWEIVEPEFNVKAFGATGDGVTDDQPAIQDALDRAIGLNIAAMGTFKVLLPAGKYVISAPLEILYWTQGNPVTPTAGSFAACSVTLGSDARGYIPGTGQHWTEVICTFNDRPAIICQLVRATEIYGFAIRGTANSGILPSWAGLLNDNGANPWWGSIGGVATGARDNVQSPHCAIAIDPFRDTVPVGNRYPVYSAVAAFEDNYYNSAGSSGSSGITIEKMSIGRFIVGVAISIGAQVLGDNMKVANCNFYCNKVCIVQGQTQNRGARFEHNHVQGCQVYVDCIRYGTGTAPLGTILGGTLTYIKWLILSSPTLDSGTIRDLYAETIWSLGAWGYYNGGHSLLIDRCHIKFVDDNDGVNPLQAADWHFWAQAPVTFYGGYLGFNNNAVNRMSIWNFSGARILFDGNIMLDGVPQFSSPERAEFRSVRVRFEQGGMTFGISNYYNEPLSTVGAIRSSMPPGAIIVENATDRRWRSISSWDLVTVQSTAVTISVPAASLVTGTAQFTCNPIANSKYIQVGDELVSTTTLWYGHHPDGGIESNVNRSCIKLILGRVSSVNDTTGVVVLSRVPISLPNGLSTTLGHHRMPIAHPITIATTTSGSKVLTNVNPAVTANSIWMFWANQGERINGTGIPANARVNAYDVGANTITISHDATASGITEIYDAKFVLEEGSAASIPASGVWAKGTFMRNSAIAAKDASNMVLRGWVCTVSGSPGTWEPQYTSAVSPAT